MRQKVKDVISTEISIRSSKIASLKDLLEDKTVKETKWTEVVAGGHKRFTKASKLITQLPVIINRYELPHNSDICEKLASTPESDRKKEANCKKKDISKGKKNKIIIIGDSHAKGCAAVVKHNLENFFEVQCFVEQGTTLETTTNTAKEDIEKLTKKDVVVLWGGTKDVGRNETRDGLKQTQAFVKKNSHMNVILISVPHRHDLDVISYVHTEVRVFSRKLQKQMRSFENTVLLDVDQNRDLFTKHGLHMNTNGKETSAPPPPPQNKK
jgi:hypothetical protein